MQAGHCCNDRQTDKQTHSEQQQQQHLIDDWRLCLSVCLSVTSDSGKRQQLASSLLAAVRAQVLFKKIKIVYSVWQQCMLDSHNYNKIQI